MLKLLGACFVIFASSALSFLHIFKKRETKKALSELCEFLTALKNHISYLGEPIPLLIARLAEENEVLQNEFLRDLKYIYENDETKPLREIWQEALSDFSISKKLPSASASVLELFGSTLGTMDKETELDRIDTCIKDLKATLDNLEKNSEKTEKMTKSLGVTLGILIVILFL